MTVDIAGGVSMIADKMKYLMSELLGFKRLPQPFIKIHLNTPLTTRPQTVNQSNKCLHLSLTSEILRNTIIVRVIGHNKDADNQK